jgi:CBS domain-containing protein
VAADDRSAPVSDFSHATPTHSTAGGATQTAAFAVGALRVELSAARGAARVVVTSGDDREIYVVEPAALASWARATVRLLSLAPARGAGQGAEYRAPFLIDREGRPAIAFEGLVTTQAVTFRLLTFSRGSDPLDPVEPVDPVVSAAGSRLAGIVTTADLIRSVTDAASGAATVALTGDP